MSELTRADFQMALDDWNRPEIVNNDWVIKHGNTAVEALQRAAHSPSIEAGLKAVESMGEVVPLRLVPISPTDEMVKAMFNAGLDASFKSVYQAAINAAPVINTEGE